LIQKREQIEGPQGRKALLLGKVSTKSTPEEESSEKVGESFRRRVLLRELGSSTKTKKKRGGGEELIRGSFSHSEGKNDEGKQAQWGEICPTTKEKVVHIRRKWTREGRSLPLSEKTRCTSLYGRGDHWVPKGERKGIEAGKGPTLSQLGKNNSILAKGKRDADGFDERFRGGKKVKNGFCKRPIVASDGEAHTHREGKRENAGKKNLWTKIQNPKSHTSSRLGGKKEDRKKKKKRHTIMTIV